MHILVFFLLQLLAVLSHSNSMVVSMQLPLTAAEMEVEYNKDGPYTSVGTTQGSFKAILLDESTITVNASLTSSTSSQQALPLVIFINGFQLPKSYYDSYARRLATWGYAVLRYDMPKISPLLPFLRKILSDEDEVNFVIPASIQWAGALQQGLIDLNRIGFIGHSRGGKLSTLAYLQALDSHHNPPPMNIALALIDPVDLTDMTRNKPSYPSAASALKDHLGVRALVVRAEIVGPCNPSLEGPDKIWPLLSNNSWLIQARGSGHMSYTDAQGVVGWALDRLCGGGGGSEVHERSRFVAHGAIVAWLERELRPQSGDNGEGYLRWARGDMKTNDPIITRLEVKEE